MINCNNALLGSYLRNRTGSSLNLNNYSYSYTANTNRLASITNSVNSTTGTYNYDATGNVTRDDKQNVSNAVWNVYGKLQSVTKTNGVQISYTYSSAGNRILKKVTDTTEAYVYDATGNIMSVYKQAGASAPVVQTELPLYGSKRIGTVNNKTVPDSNVTLIGGFGFGVKSVFTRGQKEYLLTDHRENTMASITDRRQQYSAGGINVDYYVADVRTASYYSAYGAISNAFNTDSIKYAFNGQRRSTEISSTAQTALYWEYNGDVGRRWNVDPLAHKFTWQSPYLAMDDNPTLKTDPTGMAASPIYVDGLYMGTDDQGFKGNALLMTSAKYNKLSEATKNQITNHTLSHSTAVKLGQTLGKAIDNLATSSNARIDFEIVSKVINNIVSKTDLKGLDMKKLYGGSISTFYESSDLKRWGSYNDGNRVSNAFANTDSKNNKVTFQLLRWGDNEVGNKFRPTVENLQNVFVHEEGGHYLKGLGSDAPDHIKVYQFQMSHPTWNGTTPYFKGYEKDILKEYEKDLQKK